MVDLGQLSLGQERFLIGPVGGHVRLARDPRSLCLLCKGKLPLLGDEEVLVFPVPIA
jgi:hypothetical protein